mmetsp:Transcript_32979/g.63358  ORF Transcript_32979/g.63358 Transcript_32979/m.63358 type:complete len:242 (+) Transcript_32979:127-852(+)
MDAPARENLPSASSPWNQFSIWSLSSARNMLLISSKVGRSSGSALQHFCINCVTDSGNSSGMVGRMGGSSCGFVRRSSTCWGSSYSSYGSRCVKISNMVIPNEYTSDLMEGCAPVWRISGAVQKGVPMRPDARFFIDSPKSDILTEKLFPTSTFPVFKSLWSTGGWVECRYNMPLTRSSRMFITISQSSCMVWFCNRSYREPFFMFSSTMRHSAFFSTTAPITVMMLGWRRFVSTCISCMN